MYFYFITPRDDTPDWTRWVKNSLNPAAHVGRHRRGWRRLFLDTVRLANHVDLERKVTRLVEAASSGFGACTVNVNRVRSELATKEVGGGVHTTTSVLYVDTTAHLFDVLGHDECGSAGVKIQRVYTRLFARKCRHRDVEADAQLCGRRLAHEEWMERQRTRARANMEGKNEPKSRCAGQ